MSSNNLLISEENAFNCIFVSTNDFTLLVGFPQKFELSKFVHFVVGKLNPSVLAKDCK